MSVAAPIRQHAVLAKRSDDCEVCFKRIVAGESMIAKVDNHHGWIHEECAVFLSSYDECDPAPAQETPARGDT